MSKSINLFVLIWMFFLLDAGPALAGKDEQPVAVLTGAEGNVTALYKKKEIKPEPGAPIYTGAEINTGKASEAYLLFTDNTVKVVEENSRYLVEQSRGKEDIHEFPGRTAIEEERRKFRDLMIGFNYGFGENGEEEIQIYPRHIVSDMRPVFIWQAEPDKHYDIEILSDTDIVIVKSKNAASPFTYPKDLAGLEYGKSYKWKITLKDDSKFFEQNFRTISRKISNEFQEEMNTSIKANMDDSAKLFIRGSIYKQFRLYADAALIYKQYSERYPDAEFPARELAFCYYEIGLTGASGKIAERFAEKK